MANIKISMKELNQAIKSLEEFTEKYNTTLDEIKKIIESDEHWSGEEKENFKSIFNDNKTHAYSEFSVFCQELLQYFDNSKKLYFQMYKDFEEKSIGKDTSNYNYTSIANYSYKNKKSGGGGR